MTSIPDYGPSTRAVHAEDLVADLMAALDATR
jgi:hypothetical protein